MSAEFIPRAHDRLVDACRLARKGETDWEYLQYGMGRNELPELLYFIGHFLPDDQFLKGLHDAWTGAEWPERIMPRRDWLPLFERAGYHDRNGPAQPPEVITLWRGGTLRTRMAWTDNRERAEFFAASPCFPTPRKLWTVTVRADRLLAHYHDPEIGRGEEYVINPTGLRPEQVD
jgi:hypothetical protein